MNKDKPLKKLMRCSIVCMVLFIMFIVTNRDNMFVLANLLSFICIPLLLLNYIGTSTQRIYGPICSLIVSIILIATLNVINIIFGLSLLINSVNAIKVLKKV